MTAERTYDSTVTTDPADAAEPVHSHRTVQQWRTCKNCGEQIVAGRLCGACWQQARNEAAPPVDTPQRRHSSTAGSDGTSWPELHAAASREKYGGRV